VLARVVARYHLFCHAHCLMGNHYDLLLETPDANLSREMRQLNGVYSQAFNRRHERAGMRWKAASAPPRTKRRRRPS
jgi:REP element-mobilizing transposase RayT